MLSKLRAKINVLECLMSANRWDEIEFDKIPSKAGLIYKNAFARRDIIKEKYKAFAEDTTKKVNAGALYPYEVVKKAIDMGQSISTTERLMINKYWDNLTDYFNDCSFNGIAVVDTSGSMYSRYGNGGQTLMPIHVALSLGLYCADKAKGPFANHFITFSSRPELQEISGKDIVDKIRFLECADWGFNTDIKRVFDLLLRTALNNNCKPEDLPQNIIIISDMEFDLACRVENYTFFESEKERWKAYGYTMPKLIFWNVNARHDLIPMRDDGNVTFVSGASPVIFEMIMKGKTAKDLMFEKLDDERYSCVK